MCVFVCVHVCIGGGGRGGGYFFPPERSGGRSLLRGKASLIKAGGEITGSLKYIHIPSVAHGSARISHSQ